MKINKLIIISLVLLSLTCSLTVLCAANNENLKVEGNVLTFHDVKFNIPDGFEIEENSAEVEKNNQMQSDDTMKLDTCMLKHKSKGYITINVCYGANFTEPGAVENAEKKTINNVDGYLSNSNGTYMFSYLSNGNSVDVSATDEDLLSQVVVKQ